MNMKEKLTDEEVEIEIERLLSSPLVKLAKREEALRIRRRQYMYKLRTYEKKGKELKAAGITFAVLEKMYSEEEDD